MEKSLNTSRKTGESSYGGALYSEVDVSMDMTEAQTGRILGLADDDDPFQCLFPSQDMYAHSDRGVSQTADTMKTKQQQSIKTPGHSEPKDMASLKNPSLHAFHPSHKVNFEARDECRDKTVMFAADDDFMDMTQSHTVNIAGGPLAPQQMSADSLDPGFKSFLASLSKPSDPSVNPVIERVIHPTAASSKVTINTNSSLSQLKTPRADVGKDNRSLNTSRSFGESFVGGAVCPEDDVSMNMTEALTGNIIGVTGSDDPFQFLCPTQDMHPHSEGLKKAEIPPGQRNSEALASSSRTGMEKTKVQRHQAKFDSEDDYREKTVRFSGDDAGIDMTQSHTVNIATNFKLQSRQSSGFLPSCGEKTVSGPWANPVITKAVAPAAPSPLEGVSTNGYLDQLHMEKAEENDVNMDMTEAQTGRILGQTCTDESPQCLSSTQDSYTNSDHLKETEATAQQSNETLGSSNPDGVEITNCPQSFDSNDTKTREEPKPRNETCTLSQKMESSPSAVDQDADVLRSRKSRRMSLADLQSKVRRLSHIINTAPDAIAMENSTTPLPQLDDDLDENSEDKTKSMPVAEPEAELGLVNTQDNTQAQCLTQGEEEVSTTTATPFNLKTKQLMSRLSVGGFKPKLPQRSKPDDPKKVKSFGEPTRTMTINVTNQLTNFDNDVSDIYDEELESYEDVSETLDMRSPQKITEKVSPSLEFNTNEPLDEDAFEEDLISAAHGIKRPLPTDENDMEDEKRMKASTETAADAAEMELQPHSVESDANITTAPNMTTHTTDCFSSGLTASIRCEATFESTFKQSLFESQLEDYTSDEQKKLDDGTITVMEFFKLFNIDFVIHNPRQSVLPGRLLSDSDSTPMDLLKDKHISRPKQMVYEEDVLILTEKVEGLKVRMRDLDKPLKIVNRPLWEEMRSSSEKELKSFGAKLKERNNFFRKTSKAQSHEMKEVLYSNLVQANLEEQKKLRGTIEEADEMIKSLDECICQLETELAAVEEKGFDDKPSLKSCQEEMKKVTETLADDERQISELELQKKQNSNKLNRLKAETKNFESHVTILHMVNEWKFGEKTDNCTTYTFLHETMHLQLVYEKSNGTDDDNQSERKISHITFKLQLDDEKSQCHARLVHKLLSQYIESETSWVEKYPTRRHVAKLLHDVSLVVSRCRLLGEEIRLLKMWGGLRLDILDISCVDTQVHIIFSSLKKFSKFEVVFSVSLMNHICVLQVESFKNIIGSTAIPQIEEIVACFSPGKNLLTKIVKKIHHRLLC
ncbi:uncharacterized protein AKAME5_000333900 [Lates japonicus]|uniref:Knl1 C-terminal RWD domain-containing protein n=1 Tax=Lates japonicus TaxID=270547 RepID=A0AAD3M986_LATJO|nr:uncharacterized protein AKAME5_000333900 [Lates japonicus]